MRFKVTHPTPPVKNSFGPIKKRKGLNKETKTIHYYIDESGTPEFYGKGKKLLVGSPGYSPVLIIGLISIINRKEVYHIVEEFKGKLLSDEKLRHIYSLHQPGWYLHAKNDHTLVRDRFFNLLTTLNFRGYFIIGRKDLEIFIKRHKSQEREFYFDLVQNLLKDRFKDFKEFKIYLSKRSGNSMESFTQAIDTSIEFYNKSTKKENITPDYYCTIVPSKTTPELSIIDYLLWALQRYIIMGDAIYFDLLIDKYFFIYDIYDKKREGHSKFYNHKNRFDITKAGEFK